jgi:hypothetical protein
MGEPTPRDDENPPGDTPEPAASGDAGESAPVSPGGSAAPVPPADAGEDYGHPSPAGPPAPWEESGFPDETAPLERPGTGDETEIWQDETTRLTPEDLARPASDPGGTVIMPTGSEAPAWSGRAGVPVPPGGLRDSAPYQQGEPPQPRTWWTPFLLGLLALGLVGIVVLAAILINQNRPSPKPTPTTTPAPQPTTPAPATTAATPTGPASPTFQLAQVPANLVGMTQDDAIAALDAVGLAYSLEFKVSDKPKGTVISTSPESGKLVPVNSVVKLVISLGGESPTPTATE